MSGLHPATSLLVVALVLGGAGPARAEVADRPDLAALAAEIGAGQAGTMTAPAPDTSLSGGAGRADTATPGPRADPDPPVIVPTGSGPVEETTAITTLAHPAPPGAAWPAQTAAAWDFPTSADDLADRAAAALARIGAIEGVGPATSGPVCALLTGLVTPESTPEAGGVLSCDPEGPGG